MPLLNLNWVGYMVTYIKNGKNCWNILRALSTLKGNNDKDWTISIRADIDLSEGSTTMVEIIPVGFKRIRSIPCPLFSG